MNEFISIITNGEFWIAILFAFVVSFVLAVIIQDVVDTFKDIQESEYEVSDEKLNIGCTVYDILHEVVGIYCGTDDDCNAVIVMAQDNTVYIIKTELNALLTIKQQE